MSNGTQSSPETSSTEYQSGGVNLNAEQVNIGGDVVGRDKIIHTISYIQQRALTAAEEAAQARALESQVLAQGVTTLAQRLQSRLSESGTPGHRSPYKGLLEYRLSDADIFFGRDPAIAELLSILDRGPLTVLQAESGAGKTSLVQAGIAPRLIAAGHLPLYLRPYNLDPALAVKRAFISDLSQVPQLSAAPLRDFLRQVCNVIRPAANSDQQAITLYIFLDQFEEFFLQLDKPVQTDFIRELAECLDDDSLDVRWVLSLRTEYFGNLANFRPRIRNPFENDYRLNRFTRAEAQIVISQPAARRGIQFEAGLVDTLLDDLGKTEISPPQMQLVCSALYDELALGETTISRALYEREGHAAGILRSHLEHVLSRDLQPDQREAARRLLESLITSETQRVIRTHTELVAELTARGVTPEMLDVVLNQLIDSRLLTAHEPDDTHGELAYELAHDYLLAEIKLDPAVQARKAAQELLEQEVRAYRRYHTLMAADRLQVISPFRTELRFTLEAESLFTESLTAEQRAAAEREAQRTAQQQAESNKRAARRLRWLTVELVIVFTIVFAVVGYKAVTYVGQLAQERSASELSVAVTNLASSLNVDTFQSLVKDATANGAGTSDDPRYWEHISSLAKIQDQFPNVAVNAYSYIKGGQPNEIIWIGDTLAKTDPSQAAHFKEPYVSSTGRLLAGFEKTTVNTTAYTDQNGTWSSAYAPIKDAQGNTVGAVGIDASPAYLIKWQTDAINAIEPIFIVSYLIMLVLTFITTRVSNWSFRRRASRPVKAEQP